MKGDQQPVSSLKVIKITTTEDLQKAFLIRQEVFMNEQQVSHADEFDGFDEQSHHYLALVEDQPAGTARWRRTTEGIKLERFSVLQVFRKRGIAKELLATIMNEILAERAPDEKIYLHAQVEVAALYLAAGFEKIGNEFLECNIRHQNMEYSTTLIREH